MCMNVHGIMMSFSGYIINVHETNKIPLQRVIVNRLNTDHSEYSLNTQKTKHLCEGIKYVRFC